METILDVFNQDAFSVTELSRAIDLVPIKWGRLGALGLFPERGATTTSIAVEFRNNRLTMLPIRPRGAAGTAGEVGRRFAKTFAIPHIPHEDRITADDVQNIRAFGTMRLESVQDAVNQKLLTMANKHDITLEHLRAGMIQGKLLDYDGTILLNLFTEFGVTEPVVYFDWAGDTYNIVQQCNKVKRWMEDHLMGDVSSGIRALCGPGFWDDFITNGTVLESYKLFTQLQAVNPLRDDVRAGFRFQDIVWEEYRAYASYENADGTFTSAAFVPDGECRFVPMGTQQTFSTHFGPPTFLEAVNAPGLKRYAKQAPEKHNRWIDIYTESNPLPMCDKPAVLIRGYKGTGATNI